MKNSVLILLIIMSLTLLSCEINDFTKDDFSYGWTNYIQSTSSDRTIPDTIKNFYKMDASTLAFRIMVEDSFMRENIVEINENIVDEIYRDLICIYNTKKYNPINLIVDKYPVHTRQDPSLTRLILVVDTNQQWTQAWRNGNRLTGNQQIDNLILTYDLQLGNQWFFSNYHSLISPRPLNLLALRNLFKKIDGVIDAAPDGLIGDGNDIVFGYGRSNRLFTFKLGWGDCPAGCMHSHYWEIAVTVGEKVKFIKEYGDPLP
ncbi:MAG: hypothetical protein LDL01_05540 [Ignavibacterium sp.]|nr:hypothetical protein [Ignavibacterium sp.]